MPYLIDTSVLARLANRADGLYPVADRAIFELHRRGEVLHLTPQVLIEFRNMATRSANQNGLGLSRSQTETEAAGFENAFPMLPDTPDIFSAWKALGGAVGIIDKQVHDARLVPVCHVHGITHLLTFNVSHFARMAAFAPGVTVVHPATV